MARNRSASDTTASACRYWLQSPDAATVAKPRDTVRRNPTPENAAVWYPAEAMSSAIVGKGGVPVPGRAKPSPFRRTRCCAGYSPVNSVAWAGVVCEMEE